LVKIAVPIFDRGVSPVFDWARRLLIVERDGERETGRLQVELGELAPTLRGRRLAELGVGTLLCGGISEPTATLLEHHGVNVVAGLAGDPDAVLEAFFAGRLPDPAFSMPGWHCRQPGRKGSGTGRCGGQRTRHGKRRGRTNGS